MTGTKQSPYKSWILELRKSKKLHTKVEDRLVELLDKIAPEYYPVKEPQGLAGGRNDLLIFEYSGRKVLFEIFATRSQVSRDLRILDKTQADVKIAVIIDRTVDPTVHEAFLKENPEGNYPFIFIKELFVEPPLHCQLKLRELILGDEEARLIRFLQARLPKADFFQLCRDEGVEIIQHEDMASGNISFTQMFVTLALSKCLKFGVERERVVNLGRWLSDQNTMHYILRRVANGLNVLLYTDFLETLAIYADTEVTDWIRASHLLPEPYFILSLTALVREIETKYLKNVENPLSRDRLSFYVGISEVHEVPSGKRYVTLSLPRNVAAVFLITPIEDDRNEDKYRELIEIIKPTPGYVTEITIDES